MFFNPLKENETTKESFRPFSHSFRKSEETINKVFVPFKQQRDKLGRLLQSSLSISRASPNPQKSTTKMKQYLMNTISLDKDIKYQGFTVKNSQNLKHKNKTQITKKLLLSKKKNEIIPFYNNSKDCIMKRPKSAIILKSRQNCSIPRPPSEYKNVQRWKKNVYSFKFSYPKSVMTYLDVPVSEEQIQKMQEVTTAQNRRKRIRQEMPALMFVQNVKICAKPQQIHESWSNITLTKQQIVNKLKRLQNN